MGAFLISGGQVSVGCPFAPDNKTAFTVRLCSHAAAAAGADEGVVEAEGEQEGGGGGLYLAAESEEQLARWIGATEKCVLNQDKVSLSTPSQSAVGMGKDVIHYKSIIFLFLTLRRPDNHLIFSIRNLHPQKYQKYQKVSKVNTYSCAN